ncbi:Zinc finger protein CONSTANS-LIKE 4, partial [Cucurbita argyrosperma subsp. sororia]
MHSHSAATADASLSHLQPPPPFPSFSNLIYSHNPFPMVEALEVSYSGSSSGGCSYSSYGSPTSHPGLSHGPTSRRPLTRAYSSGHNERGGEERAWSSESSLIIEGMRRASPYTPQEKRHRIERYKTKRNQRNFNKKIKYECRKTLADSRKRIRGRFARNEEAENSNSTSSPVETWSCYDNAMAEDDASWTTFLDSYSLNFVP